MEWNTKDAQEKPEQQADPLRTTLNTLALLGTLTLLACAPAIVIACWKWALE